MIRLAKLGLPRAFVPAFVVCGRAHTARASPREVRCFVLGDVKKTVDCCVFCAIINVVEGSRGRDSKRCATWRR